VIVLDTNVLSELAKAGADSRVVAWADAQASDDLYTTAITEAEMLYGLALLPTGRRRDDLQRAAMTALTGLLAGRILPFDSAAAAAFATLAANRRQTGKPVGVADVQIAAIAVSQQATAIATRNMADFAGCGVPLINPWDGP
jgi:predicted nucleic acid-binding protein